VLVVAEAAVAATVLAQAVAVGAPDSAVASVADPTLLAPFRRDVREVVPTIFLLTRQLQRYVMCSLAIISNIEKKTNTLYLLLNLIETFKSIFKVVLLLSSSKF
jgi:hypothetical protein